MTFALNITFFNRYTFKMFFLRIINVKIIFDNLFYRLHNTTNYYIRFRVAQ